jgi:hypothetical protein
VKQPMMWRGCCAPVCVMAPRAQTDRPPAAPAAREGDNGSHAFFSRSEINELIIGHRVCPSVCILDLRNY